MKALLLAAMGSVHRQHNKANIKALKEIGAIIYLAANFGTDTPREKNNTQFVDECKRDGINIIDIPFRRGGFITNIFQIPVLNKFLKREKFDIVHVHTETGGFMLRLSCLIQSKCNTKFVYTPHGMSFWKGSSLKSQLVYRPLERWICSAMDMNLGMNMEEVENLKRWNKRTAHYVHGVGLNVARMQNPAHSREQMREEFGLTESDKFIASIGELDDNKNHITVIKALATLGRKDFKYVVCGVGPNKDMLLAEAEHMGLKENVILAGYRSDIPDVLNAADIFVFPSFHEGMPVSALEAMACGLPIICSEIRGNVDIIREGDNGYLFQPSDVETLARKLEYLLDDAEKRKIMGLKNKENVKDFSLESVTEELIRIYKSVL